MNRGQWRTYFTVFSWLSRDIFESRTFLTFYVIVNWIAIRIWLFFLGCLLSFFQPPRLATDPLLFLCYFMNRGHWHTYFTVLWIEDSDMVVFYCFFLVVCCIFFSRHVLRRIRPDLGELGTLVHAVKNSKRPLILAGGGVHYSGA